jgi:hypothetical protein
MDRSFYECYEGSKYQEYAHIRLDANVWGPDMPEGTVTTPGGLEIKSQTIYVDERGEKEYLHFKKYFENNLDLINELL